MDCSPPGSSVHGILQARILEWVAIPFSRGSSQLRSGTWSPALHVDFLPSEPPGQAHIATLKYVQSPLEEEKFEFLVSLERGSMAPTSASN